MKSLNSFVVKNPILPRTITSPQAPVVELTGKLLYEAYVVHLDNQVELAANHLKNQRKMWQKEQKINEAKLRDDFRRELETQTSIAFEDGREKGRSEGKLLRNDELKEELAVMSHVVTELDHQKKEWLLHCENEVLQLGLSIARKILQVEPKINQEILLKVIKAALMRVIDKNGLEIHIHPDDETQAKVILPELLAQMRDLPRVEIKMDEHVGRGGCLIETRSGFVDARLETQLEKISEKIFMVTEKKSHE